MPEGPEIRRAADKLEKAIVGKTLTAVWFAFPQLKTYESSLVGERVDAIETRGKAMLTHFSNGLTLYSHNQLYGVWRVTKTGKDPETGRVLRVRLAAQDKTLLLYSASDIELLNADTLAAHPFLLRVGPDVLDNYLRAEILWQAGVAAQHKAQDLTAEQLEKLADALLAVPRLSYQTRGIARENKHHGALFSFKVFHRAGKLCERCGGTIEKITLSSRPFYWCPGCQK
ncbi:endonuclease VIII [Erwinia mallotivora]|uniref:endonuclease VIII n=1 Tax=Erwinia mallotivora TaxID=69222 RepID=UPI0035ECC404